MGLQRCVFFLFFNTPLIYGDDSFKHLLATAGHASVLLLLLLSQNPELSKDPICLPAQRDRSSPCDYVMDGASIWYWWRGDEERRLPPPPRWGLLYRRPEKVVLFICRS